MAGEHLLSEAEIAGVAAAIEAAETRTSGEIVVITAGEVSPYRWVPLAWATGAALLLPLLVAMTVLPFDRLVDGGWGSGEPPSARTAVAFYAVLQALTFLLVGAATSVPWVRRRVTPRVVRAGRVRKAAVEQFLGRDLHRTRERNGVLIYAALIDRHVEVIADEGAATVVDEDVRRRAAAAVGAADRRDRTGEGVAEAVRIVADALQTRFPPRPDDRDELPNTVIRA